MTPKQDCPEGALVRDLGLGAVGPSVVNAAAEQLGCLGETVGVRRRSWDKALRKVQVHSEVLGR